MGKKIDLTGRRFGRLVALGESRQRVIGGRFFWKCQCDCGESTEVAGTKLSNGWTKSCGCLNRDKRSIMSRLQVGELSPHWKGGKIHDSGGYLLIRSPYHPNAIMPGMYVKNSRLIVEKSIGRYLNKDEIIHHINENRLDDRIENLMIMDRPEHNRHHLRIRYASNS